MGLHGTPPMTPLSAAQIIVAWVAVHQRLPMRDECVASLGMVHFTTIYKLFPGSCLSARLTMALAWPGVTVPSDVLGCWKVRPCLGPGCDASFYTTPEVRLCPQCRRRPPRDEGCHEGQTLTRAQLTRYGIGMADWDMEVTW